jgi:hypothetical protein
METLAVISWSTSKILSVNNREMQALLTGNKTQFRQPFITPRVLRDLGCFLEDSSIKDKDDLNQYLSFRPRTKQGWHSISYFCPLGQAGDRLRIREPYYISSDGDVIYRADCSEEYADASSIDWLAPDSMPLEFTRASIQITKVSLQRLLQMTEEEAQAEGVRLYESCPTYLLAFTKMWNKRFTRWSGDWLRFEYSPLVWVLEIAPNILMDESLPIAKLMQAATA